MRLRNGLMAISAAALLAVPLCARAGVAVSRSKPVSSPEMIPTTTSVDTPPLNLGGPRPSLARAFSRASPSMRSTPPTTLPRSTQEITLRAVAANAFGNTAVGYAFVNNVYNEEANDFLINNLNPVSPTGVHPLPGHFATGVSIVNNSWQGGYDPTTYPELNLDALRRFDFMVNRDDVLSVAGVEGNGSGTPLLWASYNTLAVSGTHGFSPAGDATKTHADLYTNSGDLASFATGQISGYAAGLYGNAQTAGQTDARHSYVMRSLLLAGTDKTIYTHPTAGSGGMDPIYGAGEPNYHSSLSILQGGEKNLLTVAIGNLISGAPATVQKGWAKGNISAGTQSVVLFQSANAVTGITASLNWNVTSMTSGSNINTTNGAVIFPNVGFEVRPVTFLGFNQYTLGAAETNLIFQSKVTGDNTQYIYSTTGLSAGTYAFLMTGDSSLTATVGMSYTLAGTFSTSWNSSAAHPGEV